jgi:hypothetical protein
LLPQSWIRSLTTSTPTSLKIKRSQKAGQPASLKDTQRAGIEHAKATNEKA